MQKVRPAEVMSKTKDWCWWRHRLFFAGASVLLLFGIWTIYWLGASEILRRSIDEWKTENNQYGIQMQYSKMNVSGYPFWFDVRIENFALVVHREAIWKWSLPLLKARTRPWQHSRVFLDFSGQHKFEGPWHAVLAARQLDLSILIGKRGRWNAVFDGESINADVSKAGTLSAKNILLEVNWSYDLGSQETPPRSMVFSVDSLKVPKNWALPLGDEVITLDLAAHLEGPIRSLRNLDQFIQWRDSGGILELTRIGVSHGPLKLVGDGTFALDGDLQPVGALMVRVEGFLEILDSLIKRKVIGIGQAILIKLMLASLNEPTNQQVDRINAPLTLQDRQLTLKSFNLLKIPKLDWSRIFKDTR